MPDPQPSAKKSDLGVRAASALVMVAVAGAALWLGGWVWAAFVGVVGLGVAWEWRALVNAFEASAVRRGIWLAAGAGYVGLAAFMLTVLRTHNETAFWAVLVVAAVMATDIGAYFAGRTIGGPKIAPLISPSKTWSGLLGGMTAAAATVFGAFHFVDEVPFSMAWMTLLTGALIALIAQAGDFFESWMKRRAGVKDSGRLIPGHGGLFDRLDGLLAVCFVLGLLSLHSLVWSE